MNGEERTLRPWDFVHCPPGTEHVFVGAGDDPCVILMAGVRSDDEKIVYPASEVAGRHGASAEKETTSPPEAYAPYSRQVRITDSVAAAPICTAAGVMSGTGIRQATVTVTYTPLSATGTNAVSGTRSVSVTMQIAQR